MVLEKQKISGLLHAVKLSSKKKRIHIAFIDGFLKKP